MSFSTELLIKVLVVLATAPVMALGLTLLEVKGSAWMQRRPGPLHVGLRGFIFPLATAAKYLQKETSGPIQAKVPKVIKVPKGQTYVRAENPKGEMGYYIISEGGLGPYRLKIRTASFSNISILPIMLEGALLPDLIAIMGSLDFVLGDVDR